MKEFKATRPFTRVSSQGNDLGYGCDYRDGSCPGRSYVVVPGSDQPNRAVEAIVLPSVEEFSALTLFN